MGPSGGRTKRPVAPAAEEILGGYFPVLDHGFVSLVDYMGTDDSVERAARVSYGYGTRKRSATRGLLRYLRRHLHTTPSEMVEFKFHCAMPMFVARQWIRHRTASVNEYSGRYSLMPLLFYSPDKDQFAYQSTTSAQGRATESASADLHRQATQRWQETRARAANDYGWLVAENIARELARIDLPLSTYTQWYWKIDLHNLLHFLTLRVDEHAQWEIQQYAQVVAGMVKRVAPLSYEAWIDYQVMGDRLTRAEIAALAELLTTSDDGIAARPDATLANADLAKGMSPREIRELKHKLRPRKPPDFELDLATMRPPEEVAAEMARAVPKVDNE